jgi:hypothetical protein
MYFNYGESSLVEIASVDPVIITNKINHEFKMFNEMFGYGVMMHDNL